jgi:hypothetical protein
VEDKKMNKAKGLRNVVFQKMKGSKKQNLPKYETFQKMKCSRK